MIKYDHVGLGEEDIRVTVKLFFKSHDCILLMIPNSVSNQLLSYGLRSAATLEMKIAWISNLDHK